MGAVNSVTLNEEVDCSAVVVVVLPETVVACVADEAMVISVAAVVFGDDCSNVASLVAVVAWVWFVCNAVE